MVSRPTTIQEELAHLEEKHGILRAEDVVRYAKRPSSAMHTRFTWDEARAAHKCRLMEARKLIALYVIVLPTKKAPVRAHVSLLRDRGQPGGGYRSTESVMRNKRLREEYIMQALRELELFELKYNSFRELVPVFQARRKVEYEIQTKRNGSSRKSRQPRAAKRATKK
jgi:hypothetical protein